MAYENSVAYPNVKESPNHFVNEVAFGKYVAYMATQLRDSGVRFAIELWNEPHNSKFAKKNTLVANGRERPHPHGSIITSRWSMKPLSVLKPSIQLLK